MLLLLPITHKKVYQCFFCPSLSSHSPFLMHYCCYHYEEKSFIFCVSYFTGTTCSRNYTIGQGQQVAITSPNYPSSYPNSVRCEIYFQASDPNRRLRVTVSEFDTECEHDYVTVSGPCYKKKINYN